MPELPDVVVYREALQRHFGGALLKREDVKSPFVVRTFDPDLSECVGKRLERVDRIGKRLVWRFEGGPLVVFHLMIAGRFHLRKAGARPKGKTDLASFHFACDGDEIDKTLALTEASLKRRASVHVVGSETELAQFDRGGLMSSAAPAPSSPSGCSARTTP